MTALVPWTTDQYDVKLTTAHEFALPGVALYVDAGSGQPGVPDQVRPAQCDVGFSMTIQADDALRAAEASGVEVHDASALLAHILTRPDLAETLPSACELARREFGSQAHLRLHLFTSPEDESDDDAIVTLAVRLDEYPPDMGKRLRELRRRYYETGLDGADDWVLITTDFK